MRLTSLLTHLALLTTLTIAQEERDVTPEQSTSAAVALKSYLESLPTQTGFLAAVSSIRTDSSALSHLSKYLPSIASAIEAGTIPNDYLAALPPGPVASLISSVASEANAVLTSNGFSDIIPKETGGVTVKDGTGTRTTTSATSTGTANAASTSSSKAGAAETARAVAGYAAVVGAGFLGAVMVL
jgi:hypothetical protein